MNLAVVLCWWNEDPSWLHDAVASTRLIGASHVIAVDGAYALMPGGTPASSTAEYVAVHEGARAAGVTYTTFTPACVWADNEREKRTLGFRLLDEYATEYGCNWFCVLDADEVFVRAPLDLHDLLAASPVDYADVLSLEAPSPRVWESGAEDSDLPQIAEGHHVKPRRCLFRWSPGIRIGRAHYNYVTRSGTDLWGDEMGTPLRLTRGPGRVVMQHRNRLRSEARRNAALSYYVSRDASGAERHRKELPSWAR